MSQQSPFHALGFFDIGIVAIDKIEQGLEGRQVHRSSGWGGGAPNLTSMERLGKIESERELREMEWKGRR